jgi:hypothetical protein
LNVKKGFEMKWKEFKLTVSNWGGLIAFVKAC